MIDIGRTIGAGFRLIGRQPIAFAVWTVLNIALLAGSQLSAGLAMRMIGNAELMGATGPTAIMVPAYGVSFVQIVIQLVLWAAVYRAVLKPEDSAFAYLRLGADEARLFVLGLVTLLVSIALMIVPFVLIFAFTASMVATNAGPEAAIGMAGIAFLCMLLILPAFIFIGVRFALAWPLTVMRGQVVLGEAWRLSRRHFWALFVCALVIVIVAYIASIVAAGAQMAGAFSMMEGARGNPGAMEQMIYARYSDISLVNIVTWILGGAVGMLTIVALAAGIADAALQLAPPDHDELADIWA